MSRQEIDRKNIRQLFPLNKWHVDIQPLSLSALINSTTLEGLLFPIYRGGRIPLIKVVQVTSMAVELVNVVQGFYVR